eukprot:COSAG05_NODE_1407_length_4966_cov_21.623495_4_plen_53_part_00
MLKAENLELLKEVEELREKTTKLQAENSGMSQHYTVRVPIDLYARAQAGQRC